MDKIKQVGKTLKQGNKEAKFAINRVSEHFPKIERVTNIIAAEVPNDDPNLAIRARDFKMHFKTRRDDNRVLLDLVFLLPWCGCTEAPTCT